MMVATVFVVACEMERWRWRWKEEVVEGESDRRLWQKIQAREVAAALEASPLAAAAAHRRNHHHPNTREVMVVQTCCEK